MAASDPLVTFVIPTIRRPSLASAIASLKRQTDSRWKALIVCDGYQGNPHYDNDVRVKVMFAPKTDSAGLTRNYALNHVSTEWTAFLDDDDQVEPEYVEWLRTLSPKSDVVVFRMHHPELGVLPPWVNPEIRWGQVGISFAVRTEWLAGRGLCFIRERDVNDRYGSAANEDIQLLELLRLLDARITIADYVGYTVRPERQPADPNGPPDVYSNDVETAAVLARDLDARAEDPVDP